MGTGFLKGAGLIKSLKEPGGNVTGVALGDREHAAKPLDMLQQTLPAARRVGWLRNRNNPAHRRLSREELDAIGSKRGLSLVVAEHGGFDDLEAAWLRLAKGGAQSVYIQPDLGIYTEAHVRLSQRHRLPAITHHLSFARQGGALAYGYTHNFCQRGARYVDRVLRGESPSRMPVEELSDVRFVVNLRTLSHLNLKPSAEALARADELIE
jgi:putative ABC transport system substrate-binding protein